VAPVCKGLAVAAPIRVAPLVAAELLSPDEEIKAMFHIIQILVMILIAIAMAPATRSRFWSFQARCD